MSVPLPPGGNTGINVMQTNNLPSEIPQIQPMTVIDEPYKLTVKNKLMEYPISVLIERINAVTNPQYKQSLYDDCKFLELKINNQPMPYDPFNPNIQNDYLAREANLVAEQKAQGKKYTVSDLMAKHKEFADFYKDLSGKATQIQLAIETLANAV